MKFLDYLALCYLGETYSSKKIGFSNRGSVLAGKRYTPNTLDVDGGEDCTINPFLELISVTMGEGILDFVPHPPSP